LESRSSNFSRLVRQAGFILAGAFALMLNAFINRFPIVYSDTSTYLASGFELETPVDRPITYGLFLRIFSLNGFCLWLVVFVQALLVSALLFMLVRRLFGEKNYLIKGMMLILFLSVLTGLSWTVSQLMPDVFTGIAVFCILLIVLGKTGRLCTALLYLLFLVSVCMHMEHVLLFAMLLISICVFRKYLFPTSLYPRFLQQSALLFALTLLSILSMGSAMSKSKHVFFMGAMTEQGILKTFLDENCGTHHYRLCSYKDSLPKTCIEFVWSPNSPFYKLGGWEATRPEFNSIIYATLTQPKYIGLHMKASLKASASQLLHFKIGDGNGKFLGDDPLYKRISHYVPGEALAYAHSGQNLSEHGFVDFSNLLFPILVGVGFLFSLWIGVREKFISGEMKGIAFVFLFVILLNIWDCATFSCVADRFGCKLIWLIPCMALLFLFKLREEKAKEEINELNG
jgi:hypothetical protein